MPAIEATSGGGGGSGGPPCAKEKLAKKGAINANTVKVSAFLFVKNIFISIVLLTTDDKVNKII